jgi:hypothetical protein
VLQNKLNNGEYANLAQVESDCKRLVNNAKAYNDKKSIIYEDAERIRKTASNWMVKHNPAYRDGSYVATATPIPGEDNSTPSKPPPRTPATPRTAHTPATLDTVDRPRRAAAIAASATPAPSKLRQSASVAPGEDDGGPDFAGKTFQQAQEQIVREIIDFEDQGLQIFLPFLNLPSRSLKDYYQVIKDPMSLAAIQKKVRGVVGREAPTGNTLLKSWDAFEQTFSLIWTNARIYNEDGSDIYTLSQELEVCIGVIFFLRVYTYQFRMYSTRSSEKQRQRSASRLNRSSSSTCLLPHPPRNNSSRSNFVRVQDPMPIPQLHAALRLRVLLLTTMLSCDSNGMLLTACDHHNRHHQQRPQLLQHRRTRSLDQEQALRLSSQFLLLKPRLRYLLRLLTASNKMFSLQH